MPLSVILSPQTKPVILAQIKNHLRIDHDEDDSYLLELADAATLHVEAVTGHFLITRTVRQYIEDLPTSRSICLEAWPVKATTQVRGYNGEGNEVILSSDDYRLDTRIDPPALIFKDTFNLGSVPNGLEADFIAGHGETGVDIPSNIVRAILVLIAHWYEFRGTLAAGDETALIPQGINALLSPVRRVRL